MEAAMEKQIKQKPLAPYDHAAHDRSKINKAKLLLVISSTYFYLKKQDAK